jgi:AcrR family transcriptional regulator
MIVGCAEKTFAQLTISDVVSLARVSRTTFYNHFPSKRACFDIAVEVCIAEMQVAATDSRVAGDSPAETVRKATAAVLALLVAKPNIAHTALSEAVVVNPAAVGDYRTSLIPAVEACWLGTGEPMPGTSNAQMAFGRVQVLVFHEVSAGRAAHLSELLPEIVYMVMLPFAGHEEALRQALLTSVVAAPAALDR